MFYVFPRLFVETIIGLLLIVEFLSGLFLYI